MFQFWDPRVNDWVDDWTRTNQLPKLVKVSVRFGSPSRSYSSQARDEVTRMVALPSIAVPATWQVPTQGRPPVPALPPPAPAR